MGGSTMNRVFAYAAMVTASLAIFRIYAVSTAPQFSSWHPVSIQPGQTIWQFGDKLSHVANVDPRVVVQAIVDRNHISGSGSIQPGQVVLIPGQVSK